MPRGRKIENPLREGLPSKVYLAAFSAEKTVGEIAEEVYGKEKKSNRTRISNTINNEDYAYLYIKKPITGEEDLRERHILSNVEPFLDELENSVELNPEERRQLEDYVSGAFRRVAKDEYLKADYEKSVDAYSELLGLLLLLFGSETSARKSGKMWKKLGFSEIFDLDNLPFDFSEEGPRKTFYSTWEEMAKEGAIEKQPWMENEIREPLKDFPDDLLERVREKASTSGSVQTLKYAMSAFEMFPWLEEQVLGEKPSEDSESSEN